MQMSVSSIAPQMKVRTVKMSSVPVDPIDLNLKNDEVSCLFNKQYKETKLFCTIKTMTVMNTKINRIL